MSTVHKHFPITSYPGSSWGQGPQVVFHVSNPLWGNRRKKKGWRGGLENQISNLRGKSQQVLMRRLFFNLLRSSVTAEMTAGCPSSLLLQHFCHYPHNRWRVIWVPRNRRCQAFQGCLLITPSGLERSQSPESPHGSMPASRGSPVWLAVRRVEAGVLALTCWLNNLEPQLQKNLLENEESWLQLHVRRWGVWGHNADEALSVVSGS